MDKKIEILLFEDNPGDANLIEEMLEEFADFPYKLKNVETLKEGLELLKEHQFNVILSDLRLPDSDGIETFLDIHAINSRIPIIILTGINDEKIGIDAVKKGAQDYLVKGQVDGRLLSRSIRYSIERKRAEETLARIEEVRKKEIHHRIKNNLQIVSSLLDLQAEKFAEYEVCDTSSVLKAFQDSQNRVISMALIHEELYESRDTNTLNFAAYLKKLTKELFRCYNVDATGTHLDLEIEEKVFLEMDTVVPLGILVNELISNSLKHAFPSINEGKIQIKLYRELNEEYNTASGSKNGDNASTSFTLVVSDNGVGVPEDLDLENPETLGMQLITTLVDQLEGELEVNRDYGTEFCIKFAIEEK